MSVQNFSFLARLEVSEKFVVGWGSIQSLGVSFSQAEQFKLRLAINQIIFGFTGRHYFLLRVLELISFTYITRYDRYLYLFDTFSHGYAQGPFEEN